MPGFDNPNVQIIEAFQLSEGPLLLVGNKPCQLELPFAAELLVKGESWGFVEVAAQRMPGPGLPQEYCVLELVSVPEGTVEAVRLKHKVELRAASQQVMSNKLEAPS